MFLQAYFNLISYQFPWRVRYELISKVDKLAEVLGSPEKFKPFLTYMIKYINDIEPEIRSISCLKLREIIPYVEADDVTNKIIPALKTIPQDANVYVRSTYALNQTPWPSPYWRSAPWWARRAPPNTSCPSSCSCSRTSKSRCS